MSKKVLIIEDEPIIATRLKRQLADIDDTLTVEGPLQTIADVKTWLAEHNDYYLIFSDIQLRDGDVFQAFRAVRPQSFVIFTTAYDEYAIEAFRNNGLDYLLKPFTTEQLRAAMQKVSLARSTTPDDPRMTRLLEATRVYRKRFLLGHGDELVPVRSTDISYFYLIDRTTRVMTTDGKAYTIDRTLSELEEQLDPAEFFRLNRQYIAHITAIRRVGFFFNSKLTVRLHGCSESIPISKEKSAQLRKWLNEE